MSNEVPPQTFWQSVVHRIMTHPRWLAWLVWLMTVAVVLVAWMTGKTPPPLPPPPPDLILAGGMGWVEPTEDDTRQAVAAIEATQGMPADFGRIARGAIEADNDEAVFLWEAEQKVLKRQVPAWNQGGAGTCVSFAWARAVQDLLLLQIASGQREEWPGHEVATEPVYGGSRVQVGGGRIRGDGSVGSWAAQWEVQYGNLFRKPYDGVDLSRYSESLSRQWGSRGVPAGLVAECKKHPVKTAALVTTADDVWHAIGNGYPVPVCSNVGFEGKAPADGVMEPRGNWAHAMLFRGRFTDPRKGKCLVVQNSWGNYLGKVTIEDVKRGRVELPEGCFAVRLSVAGRMAAAKDTFAISGFVGFPARRPTDWIADRGPKRRDVFPLFALAP